MAKRNIILAFLVLFLGICTVVAFRARSEATQLSFRTPSPEMCKSVLNWFHQFPNLATPLMVTFDMTNDLNPLFEAINDDCFIVTDFVVTAEVTDDCSCTDCEYAEVEYRVGGAAGTLVLIQRLNSANLTVGSHFTTGIVSDDDIHVTLRTVGMCLQDVTVTLTGFQPQ